MRAVQFAETRGPITVVELPPPACPDDGVVLAVRATGLCRSDWHAWRGNEPVALPHVPGHEYAGVVQEVGPLVRRWTPGDRVTAPFVLGCGRCAICAAGDAQVCPDQLQPGFTGPGSFAEQVAVPRADANLVRLPDSVDFVAAASLGCRFATAYRALTVHGDAGPGRWVVVYGCGGVGLAAVMIATALGARVIAVDVSPGARGRADNVGAERVLDPRAGEDATAEVVRHTGGGAHVTVDAIGDPTVVASAIRALRPRGRHVQVGLLHGPAAAPPVPMDVVIARELEVRGSHGMAARDYPAMLARVADGTLQPRLLVGAVVDLEGLAAALATMDGDAREGITVGCP